MPATGATHRIELLGTVRVTGQGCAEVPRLRAKEQALLAYLLLEPGTRRREALARLLWPGQEPGAARNNLRVALSRLRSALGGPSWLVVERESVAAVLDRVELDVKHVLAGDASAVTGAELLEGVELRGCESFDDWLTAWRERLRVVSVRALEHAARAALRRDDAAEAEDLAARMVEIDPLREEGHVLRAQALAGMGERGRALEQLTECETLLSVELGVAPGPEVRALRDDLGRGDPPPTPVASRSVPRRAALPLPVTSFHGRERERELLGRTLRERTARVVTVVGAGGVGKTRLALEVARTAERWFQDGAVFVPLAEVEDGGGVAPAVAAALGIGSVADAQDAAAALVAALGERDVLVVLDSVEHLADDVASVAAAVAAACPWTTLLVTSREPLRIEAEDVLVIVGLRHPERPGPEAAENPAVRLFLDRARRVDKELRLDEASMPAIVEVCRLVAGQPLGIELVAAALRDATLDVVLERLRRRPHELRSDRRDAPDGRSSLAAVFEGALAALPDTTRAAAARLSVFRGSFTADAAEAVAGAGPDALARLGRASLVERTEDGRLRMHELVRQFADQLLRRDPVDARATEFAHERYALGLVAEQGPALDRAGAGVVRDRLLAELPNIRRAWATACEAGELDELAGASAGIVTLGAVSGHRRAFGELLIAAADRAAELEHPAEALLLQRALRSSWMLLDTSRVRDLHDRALALVATVPDAAPVAAALHLTWALVADQRLADTAAADASLRLAREHAPALGQPVFDAFLDAVEGLVACRRASFDRAEALLARAAAVMREQGHLRGEALVQSWLSPVYAEQYDVWNALRSDRAALAAFERLGNEVRRATLELNLGASYVLLGDWERAHAHTETALAMFREHRDAPSIAYAHVQLAETLEGLGRPAEATAAFEQGIGGLRELGEVQLLRFKQVPWARHLLGLGRAVQAELVARDVVEANVVAASPHFEVTGLALLARACLAQGRHAEALAAAEEVWARYGEARAGAGLPWPLETLHDLHVVFAACDDGRADEAWDLAASRLRRTAASIPDPRLRGSYLDGVAVCRTLVGGR